MGKDTKSANGIRLTLIDRAVAAISPTAGVERMKARRALAQGDGGYRGGGQGGSLFSFNPPSTSADRALSPGLAALRGRSRDLVRNAPLAAGAINTVTTSVVGAGLTPQPQIDAEVLGLSEDAAAAWERAALREWNLWARSQESDLTRIQPFAGLQDLVFRSVLESGDVLVVKRFKERAGSPFGLKLQVIEADRLSNPGRRMNTASLVDGVEFDPDGAPVRYWIADKHPGAYFGPISWSAVDAFGRRSGMRQVLHLYDRLRPEQSRGVPYLAPVIQHLKDLARYSEAEITAAVISSCFAVVMKTKDGELDSRAAAAATDSRDQDIEIAEPGEIINLEIDEEISNFDTKRPNTAFDGFVQSVLRQIGVALEIPFELLIKHFTASYSASRAALLEAWKFFRKRRAWLAASFCQPVYEALLLESIARGRLAAPGFFDDERIRAAWCGCAWNGPSPGMLDPKRETAAAIAQIEGGLTTRDARIAELSGGTFDAVNRQLVKEENARRDGGLGQVTPRPTDPAAAQTPDDKQA